MKDILQTISQFIQYQFPAHYRENYNEDLTESDRALLVDFVEAYYEFVEQNFEDNFTRSRKMCEYRDIDETLEEFIIYFKEKYLHNLPYTYASDSRFVIKNIIDLYRAKGSEKGLKLLIRLLSGEQFLEQELKSLLPVQAFQLNIKPAHQPVIPYLLPASLESDPKLP